MKSFNLLLISAIATPILSHAQAGSPVGFGVKAGATLTTMAGSGTSGAPTISPLAGGVGGVFATVPLGASSHWSLQPELLYSQQGYRLTNDPTEYKATFRSNYLKLPLLLSFTHHGFFAAVGPQVGYLLSARNTYQFLDYSPAGVPLGRGENVNTDLRDYQRWEFSAVAAVGYRAPCGLGLELRYSDALFNQSRNTLSRNYQDARSVGGQVQVSYLLPWH